MRERRDNTWSKEVFFSAVVRLWERENARAKGQHMARKCSLVQLSCATSGMRECE